MRLVTIKNFGTEEAAVRLGEWLLPVREVNAMAATHFPVDMWGLVTGGWLQELASHLDFLATVPSERGISLEEAILGPLYRHPTKIWGIGLNYREHAGDLQASLPTEEPASFMKADTTLIGPGDPIVLPWQSQRVTAEAEIAVVIGQRCKDVTLAEASNVVAGFAAVLDMTAEDILQKNPRFLTRAKNFDTFFSLGAELVTPDEISDLRSVCVGTYHNGELHRENTVAHMTFDPWRLVSFHSQVMTLLAGDIISTGTPGAVVIGDGDMAECRVEGFLPVRNPVMGSFRSTP